jgi:hypothetical protein
VQAVPYRGRLFLLWGDTSVAHYPLGNFKTTSATAVLDDSPEDGLKFDYFMDPERPDRLRQMMPLAGEGTVWLFGLLVLKDDAGEHLVAHYSRQRGLVPPDEQGIARFNDDRGVFETLTAIDKSEKWRFPFGHAVRAAGDGGEWFYFPEAFPRVRVKARMTEVKDPSTYEALRFDEAAGEWRWQRERPPTTQADETALIAAGKMPAGKARFQLRDAASGKPVTLHRSSIQWNDWRRRWVLIGTQSGGEDDPSALGEVWYAESHDVSGPWTKAVKVVSHPRYSYYNVVHHPFFDAEGGRVIYFEGTYTLEFSGNPLAPARYDYNQLMYRLDLADPALKPAQG